MYLAMILGLFLALSTFANIIHRSIAREKHMSSTLTTQETAKDVPSLMSDAARIGQAAAN